MSKQTDLLNLTDAITVDGSNNVQIVGNVNGRNLSSDGVKLDGIEAGASADGIGSVLQSGSIKINTGTSTTSVAVANVEVALSAMSFSIVKKAASSRLIVSLQFYEYDAVSQNGWWCLKAKANGSYVTSSVPYGAPPNWIMSHNPSAYVFQQGAHQHRTALFHDDTNSTNIDFTFFTEQPQSQNHIFWWPGHVNVHFHEVKV